MTSCSKLHLIFSRGVTWDGPNLGTRPDRNKSNRIWVGRVRFQFRSMSVSELFIVLTVFFHSFSRKVQIREVQVSFVCERKLDEVLCPLFATFSSYFEGPFMQRI